MFHRYFNDIRKYFNSYKRSGKEIFEIERPTRCYDFL